MKLFGRKRKRMVIYNSRDGGKLYEMLRDLVSDNPRADITIVRLVRCPHCGDEKPEVGQ